MSLRDQFQPQKRERVQPPEDNNPEIVDDRPIVLHCGITAPTYSSAAMLEGWRRNGWRPSFMNWQGIRFEEGLEGVRQRLQGKAMSEKPNLIFLHIQTPGIVDIATLVELRQFAPVIQYTFDVRRTKQMEWMYDQAKHIDATFFACGEDAQNAIKHGASNCYVIQSSADFNFYRPIDIAPTLPIHKISFQGQNYLRTSVDFECAQERQDMIDFLSKTYGDDFAAYGQGQRYKQTNIHQELEVYRTSSIVINHNNFDRFLYTSDRLWRAMASGAFVFTKWFSGIETMFAKGNELDWWKTFDELKEGIDFYLSKPLLVKDIGKRASESVRISHTWENRMRLMLEHLKLAK